MTNKEVYLILNLLPYIGPVTSHRLLSSVNYCKDIFFLSYKQLSKIGLNQKQINSLLNWKDLIDLEAEKRSLAKSSVCFITFEDEYYPLELKNIYDPPICLYAQGNLELLKDSFFKFAVVGSRRNTHYGYSVTKKLVGSAINCEWVIVSGLAVGIDTLAHKEALLSSGKTIAILGSGLGHIYPVENIPLALEIIAQDGLILSEFSLLKRPDKTTFPMRNRLISGLSQGVLVVEANARSGSLITANMAADQGKRVFAIPGNIDRLQSQGCHNLIRNGAIMVTCFDDILEEYNDLIFNFSFKNDEKAPKKAQYNLQLDELEESIVKLVALEKEVSFDDVLMETGENASNLFVVLIKLETKKLIKALPGRVYTLSDYVKEKL